LDLPVRLGRRDSLEIRALKDKLDFPALQVHKDLKDHPDNRDLVGHTVLLEILALQDQWVPLDLQDQAGLQDRMERQVNPGSRDNQELLEHQDLPDLKAHPESKDHLDQAASPVSRDHSAHLDQQDLTGRQDLLVLLDQLAHRDHKDLRDLQEFQGFLAIPDHQDNLDNLDLLDLVDHRVLWVL